MRAEPGIRRQGARRGLLIVSSLLLILAIRYDFSPYLRGPAPFPEWRWLYLFKPTLGRGLPALVCGVLLLALLGASARNWRHRGRAAAAILILALPIGVGWQLALIKLEIRGTTATLVERSADPLFTSYLNAADLPAAQSPGAFLRDFGELQYGLARWAPHAATHPPTAVLFYRAGMELCARANALQEALLGAIEASPLQPQTFKPRLSASALATALLMPLVLMGLCAAGALPIAAAGAELHGDWLAATRVAVLWLVLPSPTLMVPELDQGVACALAFFLWGLLVALGSQGPRRVWGIGVAGLAGGGALLLSYGSPAFLLVTTAALLVAHQRRTGRLEPARLVPILTLSAAFALLLFWLPALAGASPWEHARAAFAIHRSGFTTPRNYWLWLIFNPLDFLVFLGLPLVLGACLGLGVSQRGRAEKGLALGFGLGLALLLLSGTVRGELGRIGMPLMPAALLACAPRPRPMDAAIMAGLIMTCALVMRLAWQLP